MQTTEELLQGTIERVTYHNPENGYCVLRVKVKGRIEPVTVLGHLSSATAGELIESHGQWTQHRDFGAQFKAESLKTIHPTTLEGIEKYLGSGMIKGIGPSRAQQISTAWQDQKAIREIMVFLQSHGVSTSRAVRIYKTYGDQAISKVTENPYQLARDIHGIGFKSADLIASHLGISKTSLIRARAGLGYALQERIGEGHCAYPEQTLIQEAATFLEIEVSILQEGIELEITDNFLVREEIDGTPCIYPVSLHRFETETAKLIRRLSQEGLPWKPFKIEDHLGRAEKEMNIQLDPQQKEAIAQSLVSKLLIITGGPGTGKTTLTRSIISILKAQGVRIALCSPTGRAAKRLSECTRMEAKTIHRLLGFDPKKNGFLYHKENPLPIDLLLIDEASMVDLPLMSQLLKAIPPHAALIIVGDEDQLPSVGPGTVLKSFIDSERIPMVRLTQIFRQSAQSQIIQAAHHIKQGEMPDLSRRDKDSDFHFIGIEEPELTLSKLLELVSQRIPKAFGFDAVKDIQVLSPMHKGILGSRTLNLELQKILNPNPETKIERFGITYAVGDKVMVIANDYDKEVFNGDIGTILSIDLTEQTVLIDFDGRHVPFEFGELDLISLAYAISIHKSQSSEYPAVVLPLSTQHFALLKRNLIYTGITRGKKLVILIGQKKALGLALKTRGQELRWNNLARRIQALS